MRGGLSGFHGALPANFCRIVRKAACHVARCAVTMRRPTVKAASAKTLAQTTPNVLSSAGIRLMTPPRPAHLQRCKRDADAATAPRRTVSAHAPIAVRGPLLRVAVITRQRCSHYTADASRSRCQSTREYPLTRIVCTDAMTGAMIGNIAARPGSQLPVTPTAQQPCDPH